MAAQNKDYISQAPLQLGVARWQDGQEDVKASIVSDFREESGLLSPPYFFLLAEKRTRW